MVNNAILRSHFRSLTLAFLRPFERFFRLEVQPMPQAGGAGGQGGAGGRGPLGGGRPIPVAGRQQAPTAASGGGGPGWRAGGAAAGSAAGGSGVGSGGAGIAGVASSAGGRSYGPYDDLLACFLPRFDLPALLHEIEAAGGPPHRVLAHAQWRTLYERFVASPHFYPWFHARRRVAARQLFDMSRSLRLSTSVDELLAPAKLRGLFVVGNAGAVLPPAQAAALAAARLPLVSALPSGASVSPPPVRGAVDGSVGMVSASDRGDGGAGTSGAFTPVAVSRNASLSPPPAQQLVAPAAPAAAAGGAALASPKLLLSAPSLLQLPGAAAAPVPNPGPLVRVVGRGMPHAAALSGGHALWKSGASTAATGATLSSTTGAAALSLALELAAGHHAASPSPPVSARSAASVAGGAAPDAPSQQGSSGAPASLVGSPRQSPQPPAPSPPQPPAPSPALRPATAPLPGSTSPTGLNTTDDDGVGRPRSPAGASAPPTLRAASSYTLDDLRAHESACVELHAKISAAFSRDATYLADDEELAAVMREHLAAVEAVMPSRLLHSVTHGRQSQARY